MKNKINVGLFNHIYFNGFTFKSFFTEIIKSYSDEFFYMYNNYCAYVIILFIIKSEFFKANCLKLLLINYL